MTHARYAIYYVAPDGPLADFGARWLGWDVISGRETSQFDIPGLADITATPRKYGFHGTLKPPFRLADGATRDAVEAAVMDLADTLAPATCARLDVTRMGRFLALVPAGEQDGVRRVAEACVRDLDQYRAPATAAEMERRRKAGLSARQDALLRAWGYPYVFEEIRFHLTLSGRLPKDDIDAWERHLETHLPDLSGPFVIDQITLCGEREDGRFEMLRRVPLRG